jgi:hypothetical protein
MELQIKNLSKKLSYKLDKYEVEVGLLNDTIRKQPKFGEFKSYAGKILLREGKPSTGKTMVEVAESLDKRYKWLKDPFLRPENKEVVAVLNDIVRDMNGEDLQNRILNGFQAVVRNPILRGDYGINGTKWAKKKGFNTLLMMTGQFFKSVKARFKNV